MVQQLQARAAVDRLIDRLRRPSRYAQIGAVCALLTNGIIIGLDRFAIHYIASTLIATVTVTAIGFLLHSAYTYRVPPTIIGFVRFVGATAVGSLITVVVMAGLCDGLGLSATQAIPLATILLFFWNYLMANWAIMRGLKG